MTEKSPAALAERLANLEKAHESLLSDFKRLRTFIYHQHFYNRLFEKAFQVACFGDYLEFGVFEGDSLIQAYEAAGRIFDRMETGHWDRGFVETEKKAKYQKARHAMRFIGFDTFEGMPPLNELDATYGMFEEGSFKTTIDLCREKIRAAGIPPEKTRLVQGRFETSLNVRTAEELELKAVSVAHIDCDLYSSALQALDFITPYLQDGSILIFDEWYHYKGNPSLGEQRAFHEWAAKNPQLTLTEFHKEGPYRNSFIVSTEIY